MSSSSSGGLVTFTVPADALDKRFYHNFVVVVDREAGSAVVVSGVRIAGPSADPVPRASLIVDRRVVAAGAQRNAAWRAGRISWALC